MSTKEIVRSYDVEVIEGTDGFDRLECIDELDAVKGFSDLVVDKLKKLKNGESITVTVECIETEFD